MSNKVMRYHPRKSGFTLLELVVTTAISAVIVLGAIQYASIIRTFQEQSEKKIETVNSVDVGERAQSNDLENVGFQFSSPRLAFHLHNNVNGSTFPTGLRYWDGGTVYGPINVVTPAEVDWANPQPVVGVLPGTDVFDAFMGEDPAIRRPGVIAADPVVCDLANHIYLIELAGSAGNSGDPVSAMQPDGGLEVFGPTFPVFPTTAKPFPILLFTAAGAPPTAQLFSKVLQVVTPNAQTAPTPCPTTPTMPPTSNLRLLVQTQVIFSGILTACTTSTCPNGIPNVPVPTRAMKVYALGRWQRYMVYKPPQPTTPPSPTYPGLYVQTSGPDGQIGDPQMMIQGVEDMQVSPILSRSAAAGGSCAATTCICNKPDVPSPGPWATAPLTECHATASGWPYAGATVPVDSGHIIGMVVRLTTVGAHPLKDDHSATGGKRPASYDRPAATTSDGLARNVKEFRIDFRNLNPKVINYN